MSEVFLFGASGHGKVVLEIVAEIDGFRVVGVFDDDPALAGSRLMGVPILGGREALVQWLSEGRGGMAGIVSIGSNRARAAVAGWLAQQGLRFATALHPRATVSPSASVGAGTVVMAGALINADARIGEHVIVNTGAKIDHDCRIGEYTHVAPGTTLCGTISVGAHCLIGAGAVVLPNLSIGERATVGAGAVVTKNVAAGATVIGNPARQIKPRRP